MIRSRLQFSWPMVLGVPLSLSLSSSLLSSCSSLTIDEEPTTEQQTNLCEVTITINGLDVAIEPLMRTTAASAQITHITLTAFDDSGEDVFTFTQTSADADFGTISTKIPVGEYTFVAVAHNAPKGAPATIISSTSQASVTNYADLFTFSCAQAVNVSGNATQNVTLNMGKRKNATITLNITDPTPSEVESLQIIVSPTATALPAVVTFDPSTGFATGTWRYERTITKDNGTFSGNTYGLPVLLVDTEQQLDVTFNALDADGNVLYTRTKEKVRFQQAAFTKVSGTFFSATASGSFDFNTSITNISVSLD